MGTDLPRDHFRTYSNGIASVPVKLGSFGWARDGTAAKGQLHRNSPLWRERTADLEVAPVPQARRELAARPAPTSCGGTSPAWRGSVSEIARAAPAPRTVARGWSFGSGPRSASSSEALWPASGQGCATSTPLLALALCRAPCGWIAQRRHQELQSHEDNLVRVWSWRSQTHSHPPRLESRTLR